MSQEVKTDIIMKLSNSGIGEQEAKHQTPATSYGKNCKMEFTPNFPVTDGPVHVYEYWFSKNSWKSPTPVLEQQTNINMAFFSG